MNEKIMQHLSVITEEEKEILSGRKIIDRDIYMAGDRDIISGDKLLPRGKNIMIRPHTRFINFPEHTHDYVEFVYMCKGSTRHIVNGTPITLRQGELLMLSQHARQEIEAAGKNDIAVNFIVKPDFFHGVLSFLGNEETPLRHFILSCITGERGSGYLYFKVADVLPVQNLVENLLWILITQPSNKRGIYQLTMGLLFVELLECTDTLEFSYESENVIMKVLRYIEDNYRTGSLNEIAGLLHYGHTTLSRLIRKKTGKNFTELLQEKRLSQAAWFLLNTEERIDDIAMMVGYENMTHFHKLFCQYYGKTPKHYRDCT
ncbi:MAG: helix-turn-helix domain-containing protein [Synergistaceae bacterium]|nr:helix-turn-helix domain-containing protein [Synergistaceae bacterium]